MMRWKLLWQLVFMCGFIFFIGMFVLFTYRGYFELKKLLNERNERQL